MALTGPRVRPAKPRAPRYQAEVMYSVFDYGDMIADAGRVDAYSAALRARVKSESVVLDIGVGTGILTLLACKAGAKKVYAVEPDGIIQLARETVAANG